MSQKFVFSIDVEKDYLPTNTTVGITKGLPKLISILEEYNIKATLFVTGEMAERFPDYIEALGKKHEIACHAYKHEDMCKLSKKQQFETLKKATEIIETVTERPVGFRAPRLNVDENLFKNLEKLDYVYDSSIPEFGVKKFKYSKKFDTGEIIELRPIPSYVLRIPFRQIIFNRIVKRSFNKNGYAMFFTHPWEAIPLHFGNKQMGNLKQLLLFYNYVNIGEVFLDKSKNFVDHSVGNLEFTTGIKVSQLINIRR